MAIEQRERCAKKTRRFGMIWAIVVFIFLAIIIAVLLLPVAIEVNSERDVYEIRIGWVKMSAAWLKKQMMGRERKGKEAGRARIWKKRPMRFWKKGRRMLASFQIRRFRLLLDTDDFILNAYLYPVFVFLSGKNRYLAINFTGRNAVDILATNRIWRMLWALIR
jgi:hypothetical protein